MRRGSSTLELQKKRKEKPLIGSKNNQKTGGEQYSTSVRNKNLTSNKEDKKTTKSSSKFVTKNGKRYLKTSPMGKKIVADQRRKSLASKNYMSKEMIAKRKKRLKINK